MIREHRASDRHISLPVIRLGDLRTLGGEIPAYFLGNPLVKPQLKAHRLATNVTGDIVGGGAESPRSDNDITALKRGAQRGGEPVGIVAHGGVAQHGDAELRKLHGKEAAIGIQNISEQYFRPDGQNLTDSHFGAP